jgi:hypothetical protein
MGLPSLQVVIDSLKAGKAVFVESLVRAISCMQSHAALAGMGVIMPYLESHCGATVA